MREAALPPHRNDFFYPPIIAILAMLLVAALGVWFLPRADVPLPLVEHCRLDRQVCLADLPDGGRLEIALEPRPVPTSATLRVSVSVGGLPVERAEVNFQGVDMNMGLHRLPLEAAGNGRFAGETTLPVCVTGRMVWQATVLVESGRKNISVPFRFESGA